MLIKCNIHYTGAKVAYVEDLGNDRSTIRTVGCSILVPVHDRDRCSMCKKFRLSLNTMLNRLSSNVHVTDTSPTNCSSTVNFRYLSSPQKKERFIKVRNALRQSQSRIRYLTAKIEKHVEKTGIHVDDELHQDLVQISREQTSQVIIKFIPINAHHTPWFLLFVFLGGGGGGGGRETNQPAPLSTH